MDPPTSFRLLWFNSCAYLNGTQASKRTPTHANKRTHTPKLKHHHIKSLHYRWSHELSFCFLWQWLRRCSLPAHYIYVFDCVYPNLRVRACVCVDPNRLCVRVVLRSPGPEPEMWRETVAKRTQKGFSGPTVHWLDGDTTTNEGAHCTDDDLYF